MSVKFESTQIDKELDRGISITAEEIEFNDKILTYSGRQVLLYIPDQGKNLETVIRYPEKGRRFHVADCKTLQGMREQNRFDRYVVTNNLTGLFDVTGLDSLGREKEGKASLKICQNCLTTLNYKGFALNKDMHIFHNFSLEEFFEDYSTYFKFHPKHTKPYGSGYSEDWEEISYRYKTSQGYRCESCGIDLRHHKRLLVTHHINGVKSDNSESNMLALCVDCHRKQEFHSHLFVSRDDMLTLYRLRATQHKNSVSSWNDVYRLVDKALYGVVDYLKTQNSLLPKVGYAVNEDSYVDLAWTHTHKAISVDALQVDGWIINRPHEMIENHYAPVRKKPTLEKHSLSVTLTPHIYLSDDSRIAREELFLTQVPQTLTLEHDPHNPYDNKALKVFYGDTFIGHIIKKGTNGKVDTFCFENNELVKDLTLVWDGDGLVLEKLEHSFYSLSTTQEQSIQRKKENWQEKFLEELCKDRKSYQYCLQKYSEYIPNNMDTSISPQLICHIYSVLEGRIYGSKFRSIVQSANLILHSYQKYGEVFLRILDYFSNKKAQLYQLDYKGSFRNKERTFYANAPKQATEHQAFLLLLFSIE